MANSKDGNAAPRPELRAVAAQPDLEPDFAGAEVPAGDRPAGEAGASHGPASHGPDPARSPLPSPIQSPPPPQSPSQSPPRSAPPSPRELAAARARRRARAALRAAPDPEPRFPEAEPRPATQPDPPPEAQPSPQTAPQPQPMRLRLRHWTGLASFVLLVLLPLLATVAYLWTRAADQYHSEVAFSIRTEESGAAAAGLLGALTQISGGSASDADILFEYVRSQKIVEEISAELDLRAIWNRPGSSWAAGGDPVFTLGDDPSVEALHREWNRMVEVGYDSNAGILHIRANAFTPEEAKAIATAVLARSGALVNTLSDESRADAVRFAEGVAKATEADLRRVRGRLADFRRLHNMVDPAADVAGQSGLLNALQAELAQALVERDVLLSYAAESDQRVVQATRRIDAITARLEDERANLALTGVAGSLPEVVGAFEELTVDLEFASTAYTQALASLAGARSEAGRQSRYLAAHIEPTLATAALYPRRLTIAGLAGLFLFLGWSVAMLVWYNVRDSQ